MDEQEQLKIEADLIESFMDNFYEKLGYYPTVVTHNNTMHNKDNVKVVGLEQLQEYLDPFMPTEFGKRLTLRSRSRSRTIVDIRFIYYFLARSMGYSLSTISRSLGMDHTSVIHGLRTFKNLYETSDLFREKYSNIVKYIKNQYESSIVVNFDQVEH